MIQRRFKILQSFLITIHRNKIAAAVEDISVSSFGVSYLYGGILFFIIEGIITPIMANVNTGYLSVCFMNHLFQFPVTSACRKQLCNDPYGCFPMKGFLSLQIVLFESGGHWKFLYRQLTTIMAGLIIVQHIRIKSARFIETPKMQKIGLKNVIVDVTIFFGFYCARSETRQSDI